MEDFQEEGKLDMIEDFASTMAQGKVEKKASCIDALFDGNLRFSY